QATQAAAEDGILPGGGTALAYVSAHIDRPMEVNNAFEQGHSAVVGALLDPMRKILANAGWAEGLADASVKLAKGCLGQGVDVLTGSEV
ncbi:hypothetical protein ABK046_47230, partial [Streptomyces caeruleatus]